MKYAMFACLGIITVAVLLAGAQFLIICQNVKNKSYDLKPFVRHMSSVRLRFLFMGDSTAVGTGAVNNTQSVAGYMAQAFPEAGIDSDSYNGRTLDQLVREFPAAPANSYDLVVMQIGANDILRFTPYQAIDQRVTTVIKEAKRIGRHVVILHSGNVGLSPVFIWPFSWIMSERSRVVRRIYMKRTQELGVLYVDLFTERSNDLFLKDIPKYYCPDLLHPSGEGYKWWYERLGATLDGAGVVFK